MGNAVETNSDGTRVYVTGQSTNVAGRYDYATLAYDARTGALVWESRYDGPGRSDDYAFAIDSSPDGSRVFVTGQSWSDTTSDDFATVAYDAATGAQIWVSRYTRMVDASDVASALMVSPDGTRVFVTGESWDGKAGAEYATVAYDTINGQQLWASRYTEAGTARSHAIGITPDGSLVFVTGESDGGPTSLDYATVAYEADTGIEVWVSRYDGPASRSDIASALGIGADGARVFVTGHSKGSGTEDDYTTVAYRSDTGAQIWASRYNGPGTSHDSGNALVVSPDGTRVFVTGESFGTAITNLDYATVAYEAVSGGQVWVARFNGPGNDIDSATAIGLNPQGSRIYVTGHVWTLRREGDYTTVAYDTATGARTWAVRAGGGRWDSPTDLAVSPHDGLVFVTGLYGSPGSASVDYGTLAYHT